MAERVGTARGPASAGFITISKEGVGEQRVHPRTFEKTWKDKGWELVQPDQTPAAVAEDTDRAETPAPRRAASRAAATTSEES